MKIILFTLIKKIKRFLTNIVSERKIIFSLAKNDFKARYAGGVLGALWLFIQPIITIFIFWFVFQIGFKNSPVKNFPFILWFTPAYISWIYFSEVLNSSACCLHEFNFLIKKIKFNINVLPLIKLISSSYIHLFFIILTTILFLFYRYNINFYLLQIFYYFFSLFIFLVGLSFFICTFSVFFKDILQLVNIILQIGFWVTPITWSYENILPKALNILKLNPLFYIVNGYRESFLYKIPFWHHKFLTIYFWTVSLFLFISGIIIYNKLKIHFADIL